jgi:Tfp pilus assembly protein PilF
VGKKKRRRATSAGNEQPTARKSPEARPRFAGIARPLALVVALAVVAYANALRNGFTLDDIPIIAENPAIQRPGNVGTIFGTNYWSRGGTASLGDPTLYRPLTVFTYAIDYALMGPRPAGFHATNIVLHVAATVLVFFVAVEVLGGGMAAFATAAIFAVHPVHTEAVTGIVGRAEVLATLFFLAAFLVLRRRPDDDAGDPRHPSIGRAAAGAGLYLLGLFSKESAITLPAVLAVDDWLRRRGRPNARPALGPLARTYGALAVAAAVYFAFRQHAVAGGAQLWPGFAGVTAGQRILTASRVLMEYIALFIFPRTLQADYWKPDVPIATSLGEPLVLLSFVLWAALVVVIWRARRDAALVVAIAWFFVTVAPVSNVFFPIGVAKAERILYLPSVGLCLLAGWAYGRLETSIRARVAARVVLASVLVALAARSVVRNRDWRDNRTLALATLKSSPSSPLMNDLAAEAYMNSGDPKRAAELLREAVKQAPDMPLIRTHLGLVYYNQGLLNEAVAEYRESIRRHPMEAEAYNNLGVAYARLGQADLAADSYRQALRLNPGYITAQRNLDRLTSAPPAKR